MNIPYTSTFLRPLNFYWPWTSNFLDPGIAYKYTPTVTTNNTFDLNNKYVLL